MLSHGYLIYHVYLLEQVFLRIVTHINSVTHTLVIDSARKFFGHSYLLMLQIPSKVNL